MNLAAPEDALEGFPESRVGSLAGPAAEVILQNLRGGKLVFNIPVETQEGVRVVDVGWVSASRLETLRTEPTWSAAPDLTVSIISATKSQSQTQLDNHFLLRSGAKEAWIIWPDGKIIRHCNTGDMFLISETPDKLI
jgi:hypothetical protein